MTSFCENIFEIHIGFPHFSFFFNIQNNLQRGQPKRKTTKKNQTNA